MHRCGTAARPIAAALEAAKNIGKFLRVAETSMPSQDTGIQSSQQTPTISGGNFVVVDKNRAARGHERSNNKDS